MEFLIANQGVLITLGVIALVIAIIFVLVPFLKKNNKQDEIDLIKITLNLVDSLVPLFKFDNKDNVVLAVRMAQTAANLIDKNMEITDIEEKRQVAFDAVVVTLMELDVEITDELKNMIRTTIDTALRFQK